MNCEKSHHLNMVFHQWKWTRLPSHSWKRKKKCSQSSQRANIMKRVQCSTIRGKHYEITCRRHRSGQAGRTVQKPQGVWRPVCPLVLLWSFHCSSNCCLTPWTDQSLLAGPRKWRHDKRTNNSMLNVPKWADLMHLHLDLQMHEGCAFASPWRWGHHPAARCWALNPCAGVVAPSCAGSSYLEPAGWPDGRPGAKGGGHAASPGGTPRYPSSCIQWQCHLARLWPFPEESPGILRKPSAQMGWRPLSWPEPPSKAVHWTWKEKKK